MNRPSMLQVQQQQHQQQHQQLHEHGSEEQTSPPLPPTSTHPLYKTTGQGKQFNYAPAATAAVGGQSGQGAMNKAGNPWEREEREKEQEIRRDQMRHWRDQQINELSSMQRSPQQEEQLKTLILERDFERRAQLDEEEEEAADGQAQEEMMNGTDGKDPELLVMSPPIAQSITAANAATIQPKSILKHNTGGGAGAGAVGLNNGADGSGSSGSMGSPSHSNQSSPMKQPPKTASFSDQVMTHRHLSFDGTDQMNNNPVLSQLTKEMTHLAMSPEGLIELQQQHYQLTQQQQQELYPEYPPPPPERNSSYAFMSQQQKLRTHQQQQQKQMLGGGGQQFENAINNNIVGGGGAVNGQHFINGTAGPISPTGGGGGATAGYPNNGASNGNFMIPPPANFNTNMVRGDNKRVSFHDEDNNNLLLAGGGQGTTMAAGQGEGYSAAGDLSKIREDPDVSGGLWF